ncbi:MAG: hypothetical protein KF884_07020 [Fimbriimonadaceae bacterium]|nr:hypothetical protein [Fimbriimonadaceae bacterium]QYK57300.1 MAG: hypothetical protein KF884_07020 [Fimbriimonadaceae bacterium]
MAEAAEQTPQIDRKAILVFAAVLIVALIPAWIGPVTLDYPMHIARAFIMAQPHDGTGVSEFYKIDIQPVPNLGMDFLVSALIKFLPVQIASTLFITLVVVLLATGAFAFSAAVHRRVTLAAFLPLLALYDQWFLMGFANYLLGLGIGLWALAVWVHLSSTGRRHQLIVLAVVMSVLLIVCHLMAFLVTAAAIALIELEKRHPTPKLYRIVLVGSCLLCAAIVFVSTIRGRDYWGSMAKIEGTMQIVAPTIDPISWLVITLPVLALAVLTVARRGGLGLVHAQIPLMFVTLFFIGPTQLAGTAFTTERVSLPLLLLFLALIDFRNTSLGLRQSVTGGLVVLMFLKVFVTSFYFLAGNEALSSLLKALSQIPERSTIFSADMGLPNRPPWRAIHQHILNMATVDKPRLVAQLFTRRLQQPILFNESVLIAKDFQGNNPLEIVQWSQVPELVARGRLVQAELNSRGLPATDAYLVVYRPKDKAPQSEIIPEGSTLVATGDFFSILRLDR